MRASWRIGPLKLEALSGSESRLGTNPQAALRADIRRLGELLEQSLARQEGPELLALVRKVRALTERSVSSKGGAAGELPALLAGLDLETAIKVVRRFSAHPAS